MHLILVSDQSELPPPDYKAGDVVALAFYITMVIFVAIFCMWAAVIKYNSRRSDRERPDLHSESGTVTKSVLRRFPVRLYQLREVVIPSEAFSQETTNTNLEGHDDHEDIENINASECIDSSIIIFLNLDSDKCVICLQDYSTGENIRELPCRHYFHRNVLYACINLKSALILG